MRRKSGFDTLLDLIYEAAVDPNEWPAAIIGIADAVRAAQVTFQIYDPKSSSPPFLLVPRGDPDYLREYLGRWVRGNVIRERGLRLPAGAVYQFEDLMPRDEFDRTPLYNEFWRPRGIDTALIINAAKEDGAGAGLGFARSWKAGRYERDDERLLRSLAPHLRRAVALHLRLARMEMQRRGTAEIFDRYPDGVLLLDRNARILFANVVAEDMLRAQGGLRVVGGRLAAALLEKTTALHRLVADARAPVDGDIVVLPCPDGTKLTALVLPLRAETTWLPQPPAAIVFVKSLRWRLPSREQLRQLFDLTSAQAGLAQGILYGDGVRAAADRLGIALPTARSHLLEVFQKTGTTRQAELVRVMLQRSFPGPRGGSE